MLAGRGHDGDQRPVVPEEVYGRDLVLVVVEVHAGDEVEVGTLLEMAPYC